MIFPYKYLITDPKFVESLNNIKKNNISYLIKSKALFNIFNSKKFKYK